MDVGAFVQENKRWLVGCSIGAIAWLIAASILESVYDPAAAAVSAKKLGAPTSAYDQAALTSAKEEQQQLQAERQRLQKELAFVPTAKYQLAGQGQPDQYQFQVGRTLKQTILSAANDRNVQIDANSVSWDAGTGIDEIRAQLFAMELLDETQQRLFQAHDQVRAADLDAIGLRQISQLKLEPRRAQRGVGHATKPGDVVLSDLLVQETVTFQFQSDEATSSAFLESCRKPNRTLVLKAWTMVRPQRPGEPCTVKGMLQGIAFKE